MIASFVIYVVTLIAESVDIAVLAKVISPSLNSSFFNAGLLSGWADNLGRVVGSITISLAAHPMIISIPDHMFLWCMILFSILVVLSILNYDKLRKHSYVYVRTNIM